MLTLRDVHKEYRSGAGPVRALRGVSLDVPKGQFVAIVGPSGCGKSTMLHLCAALDKPTSGAVLLDGKSLGDMDEARLNDVRRHEVGVVFQSFRLLPTLTARENATLRGEFAHLRRDQLRQSADELLSAVGLAGKEDRRPDELSGGEMQRVALVRALITRPKLLLADEPTGNLDSRAGAEIVELLRSRCRDQGTTVVMVTHSSEAARAADRTVRLSDG